MRILKKLLLPAFALLLAVTLNSTEARADIVSAPRTAPITQVLIQGATVYANVACAPVPASDDGMLYLFADEVYQDGSAGKIVASMPAAENVTFAFPLNLNTPDSNLSRKFLVAVKQGGRWVQVSDEHYITNPEAAALYAAPRMDHGIKGLLPDPAKRHLEELDDLGIEQVAYNLYLGDLCGTSTAPNRPTTWYTYDGKNYAFDTYWLDQYDSLLGHFTEKGYQITLNLLNNRNPRNMDLIHPRSRDAHVCPGYAFNTAEPEGTQHLKAIAAFLGERYSGVTGIAQVDNWIIGNEVNARTEWYYMDTDNIDYNVNCYAKSFRIFYNGIKSNNASARIYNSIDQEWNRKSNPGCFLSREYLNYFNYYMLREGNIDWGLSFHPYDSPLYDPYAWCGLSVWVHYDWLTPYITMQNLYLLTDYMQQPEFLSPTGEVRSICLSEIGFTSHYGEQLQAASVVYGYLVAKNNPHIDAYLLFRQTDDAHEMESNIAEGLDRLDGSHKMAYDFYKAMDTGNENYYKGLASQIIGADVEALAISRNTPTRAE